MAASAILKIPFLAVGQAQKEITVNEAFQLLEMVARPVCAGPPQNIPPAAPQVGQSFICGPAPEGAWTGHAHALALWTASGWRFAAAFDGLEVMSLADGLSWHFSVGQWVAGVLRCNELRVSGQKVVGARASTIADPVGGATIDLQARTAILAILTALRTHGLIAA